MPLIHISPLKSIITSFPNIHYIYICRRYSTFDNNFISSQIVNSINSELYADSINVWLLRNNPLNTNKTEFCNI